MAKRFFSVVAVLAIACFFLSTVSFAQEAETAGSKFKKFWQSLFKYPVKATEESANVVADTGKKGVQTVTAEVKRVGEVSTGQFDKTDKLVTEPVMGTAETAKIAVEGTATMPYKAAQDSK